MDLREKISILQSETSLLWPLLTPTNYLYYKEPEFFEFLENIAVWTVE